jgi:hypothetical protein
MSLLTLHAHIGAVDSVAHVGLKPPDAWTELRDRWLRYQAMDTPVTEQLARAITDGAGDDQIGRLRAASYSEWFPVHADSQIGIVNAAVHGALERLYRPVAAKHYASLRGKFDELAARFSKAANTVDVDMDGNETVHLSQAAREAWVAAPNLAQHLDDMTYPLGCAAALINGHVELLTLDEQYPCWLIPLVVEPNRRHHRRRLWECIDSDDRTGKWGPLCRRIGAKLRAHPRPDEIEAYRRPEPIAVKMGPGNHVERFDPESIPGADDLGVPIPDPVWVTSGIK